MPPAITLKVGRNDGQATTSTSEKSTLGQKTPKKEWPRVRQGPERTASNRIFPRSHDNTHTTSGPSDDGRFSLQHDSLYVMLYRREQLSHRTFRIVSSAMFSFVRVSTAVGNTLSSCG